jgi:hypothetical protein
MSGQGSKPDFSGTWILDLKRSDFARTPPPDSSVLTVAHNEPFVRIVAIQKRLQVTLEKEMNLVTDGKATPNRIRTADGFLNTSSVTVWSGAMIVTAYRVPHDSHIDSVRDIWDLSRDGKVLTIRREVKIPARELAVTLVYLKR